MDVIIDSGDFSVDEALICESVKKTLEHEKICAKKVEISVVLVNNKTIRDYNKKFRAIDKVTDVLSFPQFNTADEVRESTENAELVALGDIIISVERAKEQSDDFGHSFERELAFLVVHSVLHCLGYDHMDEPSEKEMFGKQHIILESMGLHRTKLASI